MSTGGGVVGVGVDIVDLERFRRVLARTPRVVDRLFTDAERELVAGRRDPVPSLAARFAAKEAVMKSLGGGIGSIGFHDVEVLAEHGGAPVLHVRGVAARRARGRGVGRWHVSLTHSDSVAQALVVAAAAAP